MVDKSIARRLLLFILLLLLGSLQYKLWMAEGCVFDIWNRSNQLAAIKAYNQALKDENLSIEMRINELKYGGPDGVEERARTDFGMIKQGETFYQIINETNDGY